MLNKRFYRTLRDRAPSSPCDVLEIGPGHGFFAEVCRDNGDSFKGIESNPLLYNWLKKQGHNVVHGTCPPLPYKESQFDLVYAGYVLEYLRDAPTAYELTQECYRALKPGGLFGVVASDFMRMGPEFWNVSYLTSFATTERRLCQLMFDAGFEHETTILFAGNLFGPSRYLAEAFYKVYRPQFWSRLFRATPLDSRWYKLRVSFPEGVFVIGRKPAGA